MILLASDLEVVADGVEEGRRTFANILKYVRMGASSNFGNMLSMAVASVALPFLPMLPTQILLNNLLYDLSEVGIPYRGRPIRDRPATGLGHGGGPSVRGRDGPASPHCSTSSPSARCSSSSAPRPRSSARLGSSNPWRRRSW